MKMKKIIVGVLFCLVALFAFADEGTTATVYRAYNPKNGDHLYTANSNEVSQLRNIGWKDEGNAWTSFSTVPLYRIYNPNNGQHLFTKNKSEYDNLAKAGWRKENNNFTISTSAHSQIAFSTQRLYNKNSGAHFLTKFSAEANGLVKAGWKRESSNYFYVM